MGQGGERQGRPGLQPEPEPKPGLSNDGTGEKRRNDPQDTEAQQENVGQDTGKPHF